VPTGYHSISLIWHARYQLFLVCACLFAQVVGSHTVLEMLNAGYNVICVDNLCNAYSSGAKLPEALSRVQEITGKKVNFYRVDITDREQVRSVFQEVSKW